MQWGLFKHEVQQQGKSIFKGRETEKQKYLEIKGLYLYNKVITWVWRHTTSVQVPVHHFCTSFKLEFVLSNAERHHLILQPFISSLISCASHHWETPCMLQIILGRGSKHAHLSVLCSLTAVAVQEYLGPRLLYCTFCIFHLKLPFCWK